LLLLAVSPELVRQVQGGGADLPLAFMLTTATLAAWRWLTARELLALGLAVALVAAAVQTKEEGTLLAIGFFGALGLFALRRGLVLWAGLALAFATALPWYVWRLTHEVGNPVSAGEGVGNVTGLDNIAVIEDAGRKLLDHATSPRQWLVAIPVLVVLTALALARGRRLHDLAPLAAVAAGYAGLVAIYWGNSGDGDVSNWLATSAYRVVDSVVVLAALFIPVLAERVVSVWRAASSSAGERAGLPAG
jgi:hypothetical protein